MFSSFVYQKKFIYKKKLTSLYASISSPYKVWVPHWSFWLTKCWVTRFRFKNQHSACSVILLSSFYDMTYDLTSAKLRCWPPRHFCKTIVYRWTQIRTCSLKKRLKNVKIDQIYQFRFIKVNCKMLQSFEQNIPVFNSYLALNSCQLWLYVLLVM